MATKQDITTADQWFTGEDKILSFTILGSDGLPVDPSAMTFEWDLRLALNSPRPILQKTSAAGISMTGTFNADPTLNTKRVLVTIAASDIAVPHAYAHALKRTDAGQATILAYGTATLQQAAAH